MHFLDLIAVVLWLSLRAAATSLHKKATLPTAAIRNGTYFGVHVPQLSQDIFRGIPFAYAPRFQLPQSLNETWEGSRPAIEPGVTCVGFGTNNLFGWPVGEDCLNLNIVRPEAVEPDAKLPVLVWIYGGGFAQGSNRAPEFNSSFLLQTSIEIGHPLIIVSINYRLSGFGFLSSAEIQAEGITNLGLRDQWKALEWIHENIEYFGGDPDRVTIWVSFCAWK
jgi:carboxylesterase type B